MSSQDNTRKHIAYLMLKRPDISVSGESDDLNQQEDDEYRISKQKRSFDYSNYVANKRHQRAKEQEVQQRQLAEEEASNYETTKKLKQDQLALKAAKKRASRKARKTKQHKQNNSQKVETSTTSALVANDLTTDSKDTKKSKTSDTTNESTTTPSTGIDRLKQDQDLKELGI